MGRITAIEHVRLAILLSLLPRRVGDRVPQAAEFAETAGEEHVVNVDEEGRRGRDEDEAKKKEQEPDMRPNMHAFVALAYAPLPCGRGKPVTKGA